MSGHRTTAQAFVFAQGNALEPLDQADAQAVHHVFGQPCEQAGLQHVEDQPGAAQGQGQHQHQADVAGRDLPTAGQQAVHPLQGRIAVAEQHFVDQQRQQQGNGHCAQGRQHGDAVGDPQGFFVTQGQSANFRPGQPIHMERFLDRRQLR
ncbi:hypothetical protein D3C80_1555080 [compost metagenome]